jgi:hypothetical protein
MRAAINITRAAITTIGITLNPSKLRNSFKIQKGEPGGSPFCSVC